MNEIEKYILEIGDEVQEWKNGRLALSAYLDVELPKLVTVAIQAHDKELREKIENVYDRYFDNFATEDLPLLRSIIDDTKALLGGHMTKETELRVSVGAIIIQPLTNEEKVNQLLSLISTETQKEIEKEFERLFPGYSVNSNPSTEYTVTLAEILQLESYKESNNKGGQDDK